MSLRPFGRPRSSTLPTVAEDRAIRPPANMVTLVASLAILFGSLCGYGAYWYGASITGPFIFGDELEYLLYGHDLFAGADLSKHTQYGILYPIFVAIFFHFGDVTSVYGELRAFNILSLYRVSFRFFCLHARCFLTIPSTGSYYLHSL
jgi:hypothetical protein